MGQDTMKNVYQHPNHARQVIKTMRPEFIADDGGFARHGSIRRRLFQGAYRQFRREMLQYLQLCKAAYGRSQFVFPVETLYGFIASNEGLGLIAEKVIAPDNKCWTLDDLAKGPGLELKHLEALSRFFDDCVKAHVVFGEVNSAGLMCTEARTGHPEFVLVDGIGEKLLIPIRAISTNINKRNIRKVQKTILDDLEQFKEGFPLPEP